MRLGTADVLVRARTDQYKRDLKGAEKDTNSFGKKAIASVKAVAGSFVALGAGAAVVGGALGVMVNNAARDAREMQNLARVAKMGAGEFAAYAYATETAGVSAEKLSDIAKDVQDKLGDFIATGGGEFKDFMVNVAAKTGLTAEALQKLSGPDALIAVKGAMDQLNISSAEQIFYMESIANDATLLLPLLENNGKALKEQAKRALELGVAFSDIDSQKLLEAGTATKEFSTSITAAKNAVAVQFAPVYTDVMTRAATLTQSLNSSILTVTGSFVALIDEMFGSESEFEKQISENQGRIVALVERRDRIGLSSTEEKTLAVYQAQVTQLQSMVRIQEQKNELSKPVNNVVAPGSPGSVTVKVDTGDAVAEIDILVGRYDKLDSAMASYFGTLDRTTAKEAERTAAIRASISATNLHIQALNGIENAKGVAQDSWARLITLGQEYDTMIVGVDGELEEFFSDMTDNSKSFAEESKDAFIGWAAGFAGTMNDMVWSADIATGNIIESFAKMATQVLIQKKIVDPFVTGISGFFPTTASAQGNVFSGAGISAYSNSIVSQPTLFPFAKGVGLMGEAGDEAIMPLTRMKGGNLGIEASAGNAPQVNVSVAVHNSTDSQTRVETSDDGMSIDVFVEAIEGAINKRVSRGKGPLSWLGQSQRRG
jgi:hypothetical protein